MLNALFPRSAIGFSGLAMSFTGEGAFAAAENVLTLGMKYIPDAIELEVEYATLAVRQRSWAEAVERWHNVCKKFPDKTTGFAGLAKALQASGNYDAANESLTTALVQFPGDPELLIMHAEVAEARTDVSQAISRWASVLWHDPKNVWAEHRLENARKGITSLAYDREQFGLMMLFESLGEERSGLEFGTFQRAMGADPIGLLRWSQVGISQLTDALENAFEGVGLPRQTDVEINSGAGGDEYVTVDKRYGIRTHSFVLSSEMTSEAFLDDACRRLQFMRKKLVRTLSTTDKVFVYRLSSTKTAGEEITRLQAAFSRYGKSLLLCVHPTDSNSINGNVLRLGQQLLIGYVEPFVEAQGIAAMRTSEGWLTVCRHVLEIYRARSRIQ
jgi:tetratricopeptide (TPR) repeat protein